MWQERERWRQRVRVVVFVTALVTLVVAWWRMRDDPHALPSIFSVDTLFGGSVEPRPAPSRPAPDASATRSSTPSYRTGGVGTAGGRGGSVRGDRVPPASGIPEMAPGVLAADVEREREAAAQAVRQERIESELGRAEPDCVADADTPPTSSGEGDSLPVKGRPCADGLTREPRTDAALPE